MNRWIIGCLLVVLASAAFGFLSTGAEVAGLARLLFTLFSILLLSLLAGSLLGPPKI